MKKEGTYKDLKAQFMKTMGGNKADEGKLRYDLIPADVEEEIARVFTFGAQKYGDRNWEKGVERSRLIAAARRHLAAYLLGHQTDEECGTHHLANAIVNLMMIIHFDKSERITFDENQITITHPKDFAPGSIAYR